jgi:hypothetical protein
MKSKANKFFKLPWVLYAWLNLSKLNIIPKAFIPNTASILLLQKAKC